MIQDLSVVGKRIPRLDAHARVMGSAEYCADIKLSGMLIGKVLMSPYPHAKIININKSKAEKLPGVEAIITYDDIPKKAYTRYPRYPFGLVKPPTFYEDEHVLNDKARFVGDPIAAVAAINESVAEMALELVDIQYEQLPQVFDPIEAAKPNAPKIHNHTEGNIAEHKSFPFAIGDVKKGFQEADRIVEATFHTTKQKFCQLEPNVSIANFSPDGRLTVWSSCQLPHLARRKMAEIFDMPEGMIRWLTPCVGGAFGGRQSFTNEPICVALARKTGKPVKLEYTREEDFITSESRQPLIYTGKVGVKKDGRITAIQTKVIADAGAYISHSSTVTGLSLLYFLGLYRCSNLAGEADIVYTNTPVSGGMRGYGCPQAVFALEQLIDMAAEEIGMDPMEFRLKNIRVTGDPQSASPNVPIENSALPECIRVGAERIDWKEKRLRLKEGIRKRGIGMACGEIGCGAPESVIEHSSAFIKFNEDGSVNLMVSSCDMGQNIFGAVSQIAAEELGLNAEDIHIVTGDTDVTQFDSGATGSRSLRNVGNAVLMAARQAKNQLLEQAAKELEVMTEELDVKDRRVYVVAAPEKGVPISKISRNAIYNRKGKSLNISGQYSWSPKQSCSAFQAAFAEVQVDTETGEVEVIKIILSNDIGRAINPMTVEGQLEGGLIQSLGWALTEDYVIDMNTGNCLTDNFETYRIPTTYDVPETEIILIEQPVSSGPFGGKGAGEIGTICIAPAIANAIYNAVGIRVEDLPITPEKIVSALKRK